MALAALQAEHQVALVAPEHWKSTRLSPANSFFFGEQPSTSKVQNQNRGKGFNVNCFFFLLLYSFSFDQGHGKVPWDKDQVVSWWHSVCKVFAKKTPSLKGLGQVIETTHYVFKHLCRSGFEVSMATTMIRCLPDRAQILILTGIMAGRSIFLLDDDTGVARPTYKDLMQRACVYVL